MECQDKEWSVALGACSWVQAIPRPAAAAAFTLQWCSVHFQAAACRRPLATPASQGKAEQRAEPTAAKAAAHRLLRGARCDRLAGAKGFLDR